MSESRWPNNLPLQLTSFVGRAAERRDVAEALSGTRLLALVGAGGVGKTRLAAAVAGDLREEFPDGTWWVELAPLEDGATVAPALTGVLGVRPLPGRSLTDAAVDHLRERRALVVLDNCEHLLPAAAELSEALLRGCPRVAVLTTSREPLGVQGEADWLVPPFGVPATERDGSADVDAVESSDAGQLFLDRARRASAGFTLNAENAASVARICRELDGIPLAIELAAARVRMMPVEQIASKLSERFRLLTASARGVAPRHRTLRASADWSFRLLAEQERSLFQRLAVFHDGWSLEAAEAICGYGTIRGKDIVDLLTSLVDKSLVEAHESNGEARYRLLETIRQYGLELLEQSGEHSALRGRHLDFFLGLAEAAGVELETPRNLNCLARLEPDGANLHAAILHGLERDPGKALRLAVGLTMWWNMRGRFLAGQRTIERALAASSLESPAMRARGLWSRAHLASYRGDYGSAIESFQEALAVSTACGDTPTQARARFSLAAIQMAQDPVGSRSGFLESIRLATESQQDWTLMSALTTYGWSYLMTGEYEAAQSVLDQALPSIERTGLEGEAWRAIGLGWCAQAGGERERARELFRSGLAAARRLGDPVTEGFAQVLLARLELLEGEAQAAWVRLQASEAAAVTSGAFMVLPITRIELARAHAELGRLDAARAPLEELVLSGMDHGWTLCEALLALSEVATAMNDVDVALARSREALALAERLCTDSLTARAREQLGRLAIAAEGWSEAEELTHGALDQRIRRPAMDRVPELLEILAQAAAGRHDHVRAARLLGVSGRLRSEFRLARSELLAPAITALDALVVAELGVEGAAASRRAAAAMPPAAALAWVRRSRGVRGRPARGWDALTPTELQVVEHVADGLTNPQIAERMFVTRATVKTHVSHIFQKLTVSSRAELAAMFAQRA